MPLSFSRRRGRRCVYQKCLRRLFAAAVAQGIERLVNLRFSSRARWTHRGRPSRLRWPHCRWISGMIRYSVLVWVMRIGSAMRSNRLTIGVQPSWKVSLLTFVRAVEPLLALEWFQEDQDLECCRQIASWEDDRSRSDRRKIFFGETEILLQQAIAQEAAIGVRQRCPRAEVNPTGCTQSRGRSTEAGAPAVERSTTRSTLLKSSS